MRYVVLDTETTGLNVGDGHRVIEIGCVEVANRVLTGREYHQRINPMREVDRSAEEIHGMSLAKLKNFPQFGSIVDEFIDFIKDSTLVIHNAGFDAGFLDSELAKVGKLNLDEICYQIIDSLKLARELHPMKRASLDALCVRYGVDKSLRKMHGALLDARLLAEVYLAMTRGQESLITEQNDLRNQNSSLERKDNSFKNVIVRKASQKEENAHNLYMNKLIESKNTPSEET